MMTHQVHEGRSDGFPDRAVGLAPLYQVLPFGDGRRHLGKPDGGPLETGIDIPVEIGENGGRQQLMVGLEAFGHEPAFGDPRIEGIEVLQDGRFELNFFGFPFDV